MLCKAAEGEFKHNIAQYLSLSSCKVNNKIQWIYFLRNTVKIFTVIYNEMHQVFRFEAKELLQPRPIWRVYPLISN